MERFPSRLCFALITINLFLGQTRAVEYFVSPAGKDSNAGSIDQPFASIQRAQKSANPGDTVWFRGGQYKIAESQIAGHAGVAAHVFEIDKSGTKQEPINYFAYRDEKPVFDFSDVKPAGLRVYAFYVTGSDLHFKGLEIVGMQVTLKNHTQSECFENHGNDNVYEMLSMHDGMAIGFYLLSGSNNLVLNCDAYRNWDSVSEEGRGGNTDGFGCHPRKGSVNNVFRGCRSWFNSDDGYDCINSAESVMFDHCWAMYNGFNSAYKNLGDGNGFKAGGYGATPVDKLPSPIPKHTVQFCLSVGNKNSGFYANHHIVGGDWFNNTAYKNGVDFNFLNRLPDNKTDIPGVGAKIRNNLGYGGRRELENFNEAKNDASHDSFDMKLSPLTPADFLSVDEAQLIRPREADGSLPKITFMHLAPRDPLIDAGVDIGFPFSGKAPDLGAFESK